MPEYVNVEFTEAEVANLQKFFAQRQSDNCEEAYIGYGVERKLEAAAESFYETSFEPFGC
jgi:hypothetical protein